MLISGYVKRFLGVVLLTLSLGGLLLAFQRGSDSNVRAAFSPESQDVISDHRAVPSVGVTTEFSHHVYLPLVFRSYGPRSFRVGYCATGGDVSNYSVINDLAAGWYVQFSVKDSPSRPLGAEYVQIVRLHQMTECWPKRTRDRNQCPYTTPYTYTINSPGGGRSGILSAVEANPGALWLIGNEMDRRDWEGEGQDEMLPEVYAQAYHDLYHLIKQADPTARIAIGGIIQATPARLEYLSKIWNSYSQQYGASMPVDVWNVHNFIFKERCDDFGADVPPGYSGCYGTVYADTDHNNMQIFKSQIRAFRQWMKDRGQQNKPLIVSEYGIVYHHAGMENRVLVKNFLLDTFNYFETARDCSLGYPADNCRLVQRWAWYSLDDAGSNINKYSYLVNPDLGDLTYLGQAFKSYTQQRLDIWPEAPPPSWWD